MKIGNRQSWETRKKSFCTKLERSAQTILGLAEALIELVHRARFDRLVALAEVQAALEEGKVNDQP